MTFKNKNFKFHKKWSLVLWWWAARGLTYLWAYKWLEEHNIYPNEIIWNSMWAIIGAWIACWMKFKDFYEIAKNIHRKKLIDFGLKNWILGGKKVESIFENVFGDLEFENLKIPLKTVAVNLNTCKKTVFSTWKVKDAVRASMSIPLLFPPLINEQWIFVDWWVASNLPVEHAKYKRVLAMSSLMKRLEPLNLEKNKFNIFGINWQLMYRTMLSALFANESNSLLLAQRKNKKILLLRMTPNKFSHYDFHKVDEMIDCWYKFMQKIFEN